MAQVSAGQFGQAGLLTLPGRGRAPDNGILTGIYLAQHGKRSWLASAPRSLNDMLLSAPSIVIGLFIYTVFISQAKHFSGWAGSFALALMVVPVVVRTTDATC